MWIHIQKESIGWREGRMNLKQQRKRDNNIWTDIQINASAKWHSANREKAIVFILLQKMKTTVVNRKGLGQGAHTPKPNTSIVLSWDQCTRLTTRSISFASGILIQRLPYHSRFFVHISFFRFVPGCLHAVCRLYIHFFWSFQYFSKIVFQYLERMACGTGDI